MHPCRLIAAAFAALAVATASHAQTNGNWTGTSSIDNNWSTSSNWNGGQQPTSGGIVSFDSASTGVVATNNDLLTSIGGITVGAVTGTAGTNPVSIGGNAFSLGATGINNTGATQDLSLNTNVSLSTSQTWTLITGRTVTIGANSTNTLNLSTAAGNTLTLSVASAGGTLIFNSVIADGTTASGLSVASTGTSNTGATIQLNAANTYSGGTSLNGRATIYQVGSDSAFGASSGTITLTNNNTVPVFQSVNGDHTIPNPFNFAAGGFNIGGSNNITFSGQFTLTVTRTIADVLLSTKTATFSGPVSVASGALLSVGLPGSPSVQGGLMNFTNVISGAGGVSMVATGNGTLVGMLELSGQNTYSGGTSMLGQGTTLFLGSSTVLSGPSIVSGPLGTGALTVNNTNTAPRLQAANGPQTVANPITLTSNLTVLGSTDVTLSGVVSGSATGGINKQGTNTLTLTNTNTYSGTTAITGGTLRVNGTNSGAGAVNVTGTGTTGTPNVGNGGTLGGTGTITGNVTISSTTSGAFGGTVSPGNSIGTLNVGSMVWDRFGQYTFEHNATNNATGGTTNDFLNGSGTLNLADLNNAAFNINLVPVNFAPSPTQLSYTVATFAGGIIGPSGAFPTGTTDVSSLFTLGGSFTSNPAAYAAVVGTSGGSQSLVVSFTPVPEPAFVLAVCSLAGGLGWWRGRKRSGESRR
jgi:autotransporter-associated beta strand protein